MVAWVAWTHEGLSIMYLMLSKFHPEVGRVHQIDIADIPSTFPKGWKQYLSAFRVPYQEYVLAQLVQRCEYMRLVYHTVQDFDIISSTTKSVEPAIWDDNDSVEADYNAVRVVFNEKFKVFQKGSLCLATVTRPSPEERLEWGNMTLSIVTNVRADTVQPDAGRQPNVR